MPNSTVWYQKACEKMAREGKSLFQVSNELNMGLTVKECEELLKDKEFASTLRGERQKFYREIAQDPNRSKVSTIGNFLYLADRLTDREQFDKAANILFQVAKLEGWLENNQTINVFGDLTAKDLAAMRAKVAKAAEAVN
jgi:hypothetical protein